MLRYVVLGRLNMKSKAMDCISLLLNLDPPLEIKDPLREKILESVSKNLHKLSFMSYVSAFKV